nr:reverse transcriptase domain-containing protein [Tanacetum cinerariifolium]
MNTASTSGSRQLPSNTIANPKFELKAITTRSGVSYKGRLILPPFSSLPKVVEWEPEVTKDTVQPIVDYVVDPRVPLIMGRPFLRTEHALIDVYGEELTLRVDDEAITFKVGQTLKYSYNDAESINRIDLIDVACEEYAQEGEILLVEEFLYDYPSPPLPLKELIFVEPKTEKYSIDKPPELELNDLPSHLEYAFLEGADKLPVIIAKNLNDDEKA